MYGQGAPSPFFVNVQSKQLKATCFHGFAKLFILKGLDAPICTKIVHVSEVL